MSGLLALLRVHGSSAPVASVGAPLLPSPHEQQQQKAQGSKDKQHGKGGTKADEEGRTMEEGTATSKSKQEGSAAGDDDHSDAVPPADNNEKEAAIAQLSGFGTDIAKVSGTTIAAAALLPSHQFHAPSFDSAICAAQVRGLSPPPAAELYDVDDGNGTSDPSAVPSEPVALESVVLESVVEQRKEVQGTPQQQPHQQVLQNSRMTGLSNNNNSNNNSSSSSSDGCRQLCPSSTPHTVRSLTSGTHHLARGSLHKSRRGDVPDERLPGGGGALQSATSDELGGSRFDVAPPLPDGFLQDAKAIHSQHANNTASDARSGTAAAAMKSLIQQEQQLSQQQQEKATSLSPPQQLQPPQQPQTKPSSQQPHLSNSNLTRFMNTELGSQIFINHLCSGGMFLKHGNSSVPSAARPAASGSTSGSASATSSSSSSPHWRMVWLSSDLKTLYWGELSHPRSRRVPSGALLVEHVLVLFRGHQTRAFTDRYGPSTSHEATSPAHLLPGTRFCAPSHCFSLITPSRTLDLEAISQPEAHLWALALQWLLERSRGTKNGGAVAASDITALRVQKPVATASTTTLSSPPSMTSASSSASVTSCFASPASASSFSSASSSASSSSSCSTSSSSADPVPSNLSLVSALEILSDLVVLGPTHAAVSYFVPPRAPTAADGAQEGRGAAVSPTAAAAARLGLASTDSSTVSSAQTSLQSTPQGPQRRIQQPYATASSSSSSSNARSTTSSAASSVGSTPAFGSPRQSLLLHQQSITSSPPLISAAMALPVGTMALLDEPMLQQQQSQMLPIPTAQARGRSGSNLAPLPEAEEELLSSGGKAHAASAAAMELTTSGASSTTASSSTQAPSGPCSSAAVAPIMLPTTTATSTTSSSAVPSEQLRPSPISGTTGGSGVPFFPVLQPASHEPELIHSTALLLAAGAQSLLPLPLEEARMSEAAVATAVDGDGAPPAAAPKRHVRGTSLHDVLMSMAPPSGELLTLDAQPFSSNPAVRPHPHSLPSPRAELERERARLERLLERERHDHAHMRVWVAHRFLHLQSHINSLCIERNKLQRRAIAEAEEEEQEHEREIARVMGATPNTISRRLAEMRCHSSEQ